MSLSNVQSILQLFMHWFELMLAWRLNMEKEIVNRFSNVLFAFSLLWTFLSPQETFFHQSPTLSSKLDNIGIQECCYDSHCTYHWQNKSTHWTDICSAFCSITQNSGIWIQMNFYPNPDGSAWEQKLFSYLCILLNWNLLHSASKSTGTLGPTNYTARVLL